MSNKYKKYLKMLTIFLILIYIIHTNKSVYAATSNKSFVNIDVPSAVVIDNNTGRVLFEKNANEKRPMASLTKIMTSLMLVENCKMDELIEVPKEAVWIGGSEAGLKKGDKVSARSLLYGMLLPSGNDCAYTVAIHIGGSIENFAKMMTEKAKQIGAPNTSFANPHGLDNPEHYSTAKDMAEITRYALENKDINEAVNTKNITVNFGSFSKLLNNTNALLRTYDAADGVKTGFTNGANRCVIASASKNNNRYIAVVLGAETTNVRFNSAKKILDSSFEKYKLRDISKYLNFYFKIPVEKGNIDYYERIYSDNLSIPITDEEYEAIYVKQENIPVINPPMKVGEYIGKIKVYIDEEVIYEREVLLEENINKKKISDYIVDGLTRMFQPISLI